MRYALVFTVFTLLCWAKPSLDEMIAQKIVLGFEGKNVNDKNYKQIKKDLEQNRIGGVLLLKRNVSPFEEFKKFLADLNAVKTKHTKLIAIDQEGGLLTRFHEQDGYKVYPTARKVCNTMSLDEARDIYLDMAKELKKMGINYNLAPVVDVLIKPTRFERQRCFSTQPSIVSSYASSFIEAFDEAKVLTSLKHFPGYASAISDAHKGKVDITKTWSYEELRPYYELIRMNKARSIMISHVYLRQFDAKYPASLSKKIVNDILREQLKYNGVVISDDMIMKGLDGFSLKQKVIKSINAGVDILLFSDYYINKQAMPNKLKSIIKDGVKNGQISKKALEQSYDRIIKFKKSLE